MTLKKGGFVFPYALWAAQDFFFFGHFLFLLHCSSWFLLQLYIFICIFLFIVFLPPPNSSKYYALLLQLAWNWLKIILKQTYFFQFFLGGGAFSPKIMVRLEARTSNFSGRAFWQLSYRIHYMLHLYLYLIFHLLLRKLFSNSMV